MELNYKILVRLIGDIYHEEMFTSSDFAGVLRRAQERDPIFSSKRVSDKEISNDLRRLYGMGFLSRKRTSRKTRKGTKGYCYF